MESLSTDDPGRPLESVSRPELGRPRRPERVEEDRPRAEPPVEPPEVLVLDDDSARRVFLGLNTFTRGSKSAPGPGGVAGV